MRISRAMRYTQGNTLAFKSFLFFFLKYTDNILLFLHVQTCIHIHTQRGGAEIETETDDRFITQFVKF